MNENKNNWKKIYISLPISNNEDSLGYRTWEAMKFVIEKLDGYFPVYPPDMLQFVGKKPDIIEEHSYAWYIGEDLKAIGDCDAILMCDGWENSKGCRIEKKFAEEMGLEILYKK